MKKGFIEASLHYWGEASRAEVEPEDNGYSDVANPAVDEFLARTEQSDLEARLARRLEEKLTGDVALELAGLSPKARDHMITSLDSRLNGKAEELSVQRAELRQEAGRLAPHNLAEMIGKPNEGRKA